MKKIFAISGMLNYTLVVFLNAFTDLGHKIVIQNTIFKVYDGSTQVVLTAIINSLILLPFILTFSPAGFLSDRFFKNKIMTYSAGFAVVITAFITLSYYNGWFGFAFFMTFLLALQSAIYAPAKYGYIKELVGDENISFGNGVVQATTTVAILGGIIFYTVLFENRYDTSMVTESDILKGMVPLGVLLFLSSIVEFFLASKLPQKSVHVEKKFEFKKYIKGFYLVKNLKTIKQKPDIFQAILVLSLFWSISQVVLAIFGEYAKTNLYVTNTIYVQGVMALAGVGIVFGSVVASKLSQHNINVGLSVMGSFFITLIVFAIPSVTSFWLIAFLFILFGFFAGFILVPMNSYIQFKTNSSKLGTVLAGNNFVQNIFMFSFLVLTTLFAYFQVDTKILFYFMGFVGVLLFVMQFRTHFLEFLWSLVEIVLRSLYSIEYRGLENIPQKRAVLLLGNHVSWIDWALLQFGVGRKINFMMDRDIYHNRWFYPVLKKGEAIPVSPKGAKDALNEAYKRLKNGKIVALFPEGGITRDGKMAKFNRGYELIKKDYDGVIVPFRIDGAWGTVFSRDKNRKFKLRKKIVVSFFEPESKEIKADKLRDKILI